MSYQVHITSTAEHDIMRAADYIQFTLRNPDAADNLLDAATEQIGSLADLPQKFHLVDDPVLASWGIRFVIINNYLAFYTIDEEKQTVIIVRFLYQKSNWTSILGHTIIIGSIFPVSINLSAVVCISISNIIFSSPLLWCKKYNTGSESR